MQMLKSVQVSRKTKTAILKFKKKIRERKIKKQKQKETNLPAGVNSK